jgi:hypothetical protein
MGTGSLVADDKTVAVMFPFVLTTAGLRLIMHQILDRLSRHRKPNLLANTGTFFKNVRRFLSALLKIKLSADRSNVVVTILVVYIAVIKYQFAKL